MKHAFRVLGLMSLIVLAGVLGGPGGVSVQADNHRGYGSFQVQAETTRVSYVVFHALDRDGFCNAGAFGAVSLHPVLTDAPNDTLFSADRDGPNPRATLDFYIDSGAGVIIESSSGPVAGARSVIGLKTFSTYDNARAGSPVKAFPPLRAGAVDECQAWVKVISSLGGPANVLVFFHDDAGEIGFDRIVNGPTQAPATAGSGSTATMTIALSPGWNLLSWGGPDAISPSEALAGGGAASGGSSVMDTVSALYEWDAASGQWLGYFPGADAIPGANTLRALKQGHAYWLAASNAKIVQWQVALGR